MQILTVAGYYLPAYKAGGPVRTLSNVVEHLGDDFDFSILTRNHDLGNVTPFPNIVANTWYDVGKAKVKYLSVKAQRFNAWKQTIQKANSDVIYLNSFFDPLTIRTLVLRRFNLLKPHPIILAPRGEFALAALAIKQKKKQTYLLLAKAAGLFHNLTWHASSQYEAETISSLFNPTKWGGNIHIAANLAPKQLDSTLPVRLPPKSPGTGQFVFLSRIAKMKNLRFALQLLGQINGNLQFDIYGPAEDVSYWESCQELIQQLPDNIDVTYHGPVHPDRVHDVFAQAHGFLLPTQGENFGHVILEALGTGCPVIISDRTPWRQLQEKQAGWDIALDNPQGFVDAVQNIIDMDQNAFEKLSYSAWQFARKFIQDPKHLQSNRELFLQAANRFK